MVMIPHAEYQKLMQLSKQHLHDNQNKLQGDGANVNKKLPGIPETDIDDDSDSDISADYIGDVTVEKQSIPKELVQQSTWGQQWESLS